MFVNVSILFFKFAAPRALQEQGMDVEYS